MRLLLQEPFPLYPGEELEGAPAKGTYNTYVCNIKTKHFSTHTNADFSRAVKGLPHVKAHHGLHLRALAAIERDESGVKRREGEEWQLRGPLTYIPRPGVVVSRLVQWNPLNKTPNAFSEVS